MKYVQVTLNGVWHKWNGITFNRFTACGEHSPDVGVWGTPVWFDRSNEPQEPLCKRCLKRRKK